MSSTTSWQRILHSPLIWTRCVAHPGSGFTRHACAQYALNRFCHVCASSQCYLSTLQACLSETMDMIGQFAFGAQLNAIQ